LSHLANTTVLGKQPLGYARADRVGVHSIGIVDDGNIRMDGLQRATRVCCGCGSRDPRIRNVEDETRGEGSRNAIGRTISLGRYRIMSLGAFPTARNAMTPIGSGALVLRDNCPVDWETGREDGGVHFGKAKRADSAMTVPRYHRLSFGTNFARPQAISWACRYIRQQQVATVTNLA
jgi:hypothetical protein